MADNRFRPTVYALEVRDVPAASGVTPAQVFAAQGFVAQIPSILSYFEDNLDVAKVGGAGQTLLTAANSNRAAVGTLTNFIHDALEAAATNPGAAATLQQLAGGAGVLIVQANANAAAADALAARLGNPRPLPPLPPPTGEGNSLIGSNPDQNPPTSPPVTPNPPSPPSPPSPPVSPVPPSDGSQLATTIPNTSDPAFVAVGTQGLKTRDVRVGEGDTATSTSRVTVRYRGFLASNGTSFDNNVGSGSPLPATLGPVPTVIQGFAQGVTGMKVGGIRDIFIPAALGYGANPPPGSSIPPNSDLVFTVQLLSVT